MKALEFGAKIGIPSSLSEHSAALSGVVGVRRYPLFLQCRFGSGSGEGC